MTNSSNNGGRKDICTESLNSYRNEFYNTNHKYRGKAIIFSQEWFEIDLSERTGTRIDCDKLNECLTTLGFDVDIFHDLKYRDIMKQIEQTAVMDHSENDCLLVIVLSHGDSGLLYARDTHYKTKNLWNPFTDAKCPTLAGKPKLFMFQACQGDQYDSGITLKRRAETDGSYEPDKIPVHPDFLLVLSTVPGYYSWRDRKRGSWFIQALYEELTYTAEDPIDILTLLTFVCQKVALNFVSYTKQVDSNDKKQVPCFSSMLTRRLVLTKKSNGKSSRRNRYSSCLI
ncbi:caspase-1-like [Spodoptera frugiperda]|uniref:Caspase-1-like n=1 Tax=Spodoptera frugiperda TaxID=7108 RepID=A0A9R0EJ54_SPOFR|nr:caspase-1-like [Spodoptera frugiperda]